MTANFLDKVDFIIVGQGIAGSLLAVVLMTGGAKVKLIDNTLPNTASRNAGAVIHAYSAKDWSINAAAQGFLASALTQYQYIQERSGSQFLYKSVLNVWGEIADSATPTVPDTLFDRPAQHRLHDVWQLLPGPSIGAFRQYFSERKAMRIEQFVHSGLVIENGRVRYGGITADKIIFCEGVALRANPILKDRFPLTTNRGDTLLLDIAGLRQNEAHGYHDLFERGGIRLLPHGMGQYWCGSNNIWQPDGLRPSMAFREDTLRLLQQWLRVPFRLLAHSVTERPTTAGQFPLIGLLPQNKAVGVLNGLGTRGYLRAPLYAKAMAKMLLGGGIEVEDYDNERFWHMATSVPGLNG